ncbi:DUF5617 domain-containing protein [Legionella sp. WA2022007384]
MSLYSQLCTLIDAQEPNQLVEFLSENPHLDLNHITPTGCSALWFAMYPKENKQPSEEIIRLLIESKRVDTSQMLYAQTIRHVAKGSILETIENLGNPWQASEQPLESNAEPVSNVMKEYQTFSAQVLKNLMQENIVLFNKYLYFYQLKGTPLGEEETAPVDEKLKEWVTEQHEIFKKSYPFNDNLPFGPEKGLSDALFPSLKALSALAKSLQKGAISYYSCLLQYEKQPYIDLFHYQSIDDLIEIICNQLKNKLATKQYLAVLQDYPLIYEYIEPFLETERKDFLIKLWAETLTLVKEIQEINSEYAFLNILGAEFLALCPTLQQWFMHLNREERYQFLNDYVLKIGRLQKKELINFACYWSIANQHLTHFDLQLPIQLHHLDLRGLDLSTLDLTHIELSHCDLRITNIADNPTLKESHLANSNLIEDELWVYACLQQKMPLIHYFLNKNHNDAFLTTPLGDSRSPLLIRLAAAGCTESIKAILAKNNSLAVLNAENEEHETALMAAVREHQASAVAALLAVDHNPETIKPNLCPAFDYALQLGNQDVIREFYRINMIYPNSYSQLYQAEDDDLSNAKRLLLDYTKNDHLLLRWLHGHFMRNHVAKVTAIIKKISDNEITNINELLNELKTIELVRHDGSLARRIMFIEESNKLIPEESSCLIRSWGCF